MKPDRVVVRNFEPVYESIKNAAVTGLEFRFQLGIVLAMAHHPVHTEFHRLGVKGLTILEFDPFSQFEFPDHAVLKDIP